MSFSQEAWKDGETTSKYPGSQEDCRPLEVIIIGAGIAGLSLAIYLRQNGHRVRVSKNPRDTSLLDD